MKKEYIKIESSFDGLELDTLLMVPEKAKGILQIVHGMCEYKERYVDFMKEMVNEGYICCINDIRGHGKSIKNPEDLGYFYDESGDAAIEDAHQITLYLKERFKDLPITLMGHSMGSMIVRNYIRKYDGDIDRLIVMGEVSENPLVDVALVLIKSIKAVKGDRYISKTMTALATGNYDKAFPDEGHNGWLSVNKENVMKYNSDPLCGFPFTINGYQNLMYFLKRTYLKDGWAMKKKDLPILFVSGQDDPCKESDEKFLAAVNFLKERGYENVSYHLYEGLRHEILNENEKEKVIQDLLNFIGE